MLKVLLLTPILTYQAGLEIKMLTPVLINMHPLSMRVAKTLARLHGCAGSPEPWLLANAISTKITRADPRQ